MQAHRTAAGAVELFTRGLERINNQFPDLVEAIDAAIGPREAILEGEAVAYDPAAVVQRSRAVAKRLNDGVGFLMKKNKVDVIWGEAAIDAPGKVTVKAATKSVQGPPAPAPKGALGPGSYAAKHVIVATGARPRALPGIEPEDVTERPARTLN